MQGKQWLAVALVVVVGAAAAQREGAHVPDGGG